MYKVLVVSLWMTFSLNVYATQPPSILIVHSYSQEYPWTKGQNNGFIEALNDRSVQISTEYLDTKRLSLTPQYEDFFSKYLSNKYAEDQPSLIYTTDDNALNFIINQERTLFPKAKVVFSGVNNLSLNDAIIIKNFIKMLINMLQNIKLLNKNF